MIPASTYVPHFSKPSNWQWVWDHRSYFWSLSQTHLYIALVAVVIGLAVSIPLGVLTARLPRLYGPVLTVTTILYAFPSLAVFAFLFGLTGLTDWTVILPLATYALAILVRSTVDGLNGVPDEVRIAATAMGYRPVRRLLFVELPSAIPVIAAGLRVATVSSISLVTVGALIGTGGLGQLFTAGLNANFPTEIYCGIVIVAFWALVFDGLIILAARYLTPWSRRAS